MDDVGSYQQLQEQELSRHWVDGFGKGLFYGIVLGGLLCGLVFLLYHALI